MNYAEQMTFLKRYRIAAAFGVAVAIAGAALGFWLNRTNVGIVGTAFGWILWAAVLYAVAYLPLYLRLSVEIRKRYVWSVRVRWIVIGATTLAAVFGSASVESLAYVSVGLVLELASVLFARKQIKTTPEVARLDVLPTMLFACDLAVVLFAAGVAGAPLFVLGAASTLAVIAFLATAEPHHRVVGGVMATIALVCLGMLAHAVDGPALVLVLLPCIVGAVMFWLVSMADDRHAANVEQTVTDLSAFALSTRDEALELLETATGILARNWNDNPPLGPAAVARWYEENSEYYLYDLAQFHLAYKHIAFMCDVVALSNGRVLDYGAGIGDLALELSRRGHDAVYLDVEGRTKAFARWRAERDWLPATFVSDLSDVDGEFDTIISLDVFEHLADPLPVVDALVDRLAPRGRMIVTAYFGPTKAHPMHFDHDLNLAEHLSNRGLIDVKSLSLKYLRSEFLGKSGVLVFERR